MSKRKKRYGSPPDVHQRAATDAAKSFRRAIHDTVQNANADRCGASLTALKRAAYAAGRYVSHKGSMPPRAERAHPYDALVRAERATQSCFKRKMQD